MTRSYFWLVNDSGVGSNLSAQLRPTPGRGMEDIKKTKYTGNKYEEIIYDP